MDYLSEIISFIVGVLGGSTLTFFRMSRRSKDAIAGRDGIAINMRDATAGRDNIIGSSIEKKL
jgi:hypothetical protein